MNFSNEEMNIFLIFRFWYSISIINLLFKFEFLDSNNINFLTELKDEEIRINCFPQGKK